MRVELDQYETPGWCVDRLMEAVDLPSGLWLEPAAGSGNIIRAVNKRLFVGREWAAIEIDPAREQSLRETGAKVLCPSDYLANDPRLDPKVVITNPPFSRAWDFICTTLDRYPNAYSIFLARLNFLSSAKRAARFRDQMPDVYVLPNRPAFQYPGSAGGTDMSDYAWLVWPPRSAGRETGIVTVLDQTPRADRGR